MKQWQEKISRKKEQSSLPSWNHTVCRQNTAACSECTGLERDKNS